MKIANLLAQYLYTHKRLDLPGIGTFSLDPSINIESDKPKQQAALSDNISFRSNPGVIDVTDLINYISSKSGKMKVLAESDLESHLQIVQQFLNINKPFSFDGIGTLVKIKHGELEFTPGNVMNTKLKDDPEKGKQVVSKKENIDAKYQAFLATPTVKSKLRRPVIFLLILAGIALAVWGGYTISTKRDAEPETLVSGNSVEQAAPALDTSHVNKVPADTVRLTPKSADHYKYVLEVSRAKRAMDRFKQLKDTKLSDVLHLETKDSVQYKLFVLLPVSSDTTRIIDSLTGFLGKKVYLEHQN